MKPTTYSVSTSAIGGPGIALAPGQEEAGTLVASARAWTVRGLSVRLAITAEDRRQLIELRTAVYRGVGKHQADSPMEDAFDAGAILIGVRDGDRLIACVRVLARTPGQEWEHDRFVEWGAKYPPKEDLVEISRLCCRAHDRSWRTLQAVFHGIIRALGPVGRRYFVGCCTSELRSGYDRMFSLAFTDDAILHADLGPKLHHMFVCDYHYGLTGRGITLLVWSSLWARLGLIGLLKGELLSWEPAWKRGLLVVRCAAGSALAPLATWIIERSRVQRRFFAGRRP
ncbi:GNAT family N-acyltransferase [Variovorax sp. J2P1-59]|uniref:GNAT family N-acyltransferase n=1 Tax=Variovorax flavidus TaxID=3053501 RepID=UPI00257551E2|nr:GNAT family N-acyltransferase [Variovorax sp. J2P1-59]MDM0078794.1 GNAT family N-acyltransferase [Variovorax sp. J2P1-59]